MFNNLPATASERPPDLSQMSPRQAADRLFNRIMAASEQGNRAEALRFVPMAVEAYGNLAVLDRDAYYHLGLIHGVAGDRANLDRQIAALRQGAPNHLLALLLEHGEAQRTGDSTTVSRTLRAFAAAHDAEVIRDRPEYTAHHNTIEAFATLAASPGAASTTSPGAASTTTPGAESTTPSAGAALFATNCAVCHGVGAIGGDKGPALVHKTYEPSHHGDAAFYRAVRQGARAHHWPFGDMPPVPGVSDAEVGWIIAYVRELQRAAGIR